MNKLHDWVFHYNTYTDKWEAAKREHSNDIFSDNTGPNVLRSSSMKTLIQIINKTDGDPKKVATLVK